MRKIVAYALGLIGFILQGSAVIGLPVYVFFFGGSFLWFLAFFPLGYAGMLPLTLMNSMLKSDSDASRHQPIEVRHTIAEIDKFLSPRAELCISLVRNETVALASITDKTLMAIRHNGATPKQLALTLITNVVSKHLISGQYHVYRGMLSALGGEMLKLFSAAAHAMRDCGYCTEDELRENFHQLKSHIAEMG